MSQVTGYFTHRNCWRHEMGLGHPECPARLDAIEDRLQASGLGALLERREATPAALADLELAHGRMHLAALRGLSDQLRDDINAGGPAHAQIDPDTSINVHSWDAILVAAGAAIDAVDAVMAGEMANAFCAVRPPGHHACATRPWASASSTTWRWRPSTRWSATACSAWPSSTSTCTTATAPRTSWPVTSAS
jgi:acetoin utilization deacetylase AcuC-like enzyme